MPETIGITAAYLGVDSAAAVGTAATAVATAAPVIGTAVVSAGANALLAPKAPKVPGATPMPDEMAQQEARKRSIAEQMARRGRASTIMTQAPEANTLGG